MDGIYKPRALDWDARVMLQAIYIHICIMQQHLKAAKIVLCSIN